MLTRVLRNQQDAIQTEEFTQTVERSRILKPFGLGWLSLETRKKRLHQ